MMSLSTQQQRPVVILLSGGMDSSTLLFMLVREMGIRSVHALSFFYGQKHAKELVMARWQAEQAGVTVHREVDLSVMRNLVAGATALIDPSVEVPDLAVLTPEECRQPITYVPNRNLILLSLAAAYAESQGIQDVFYGAQLQDAYGYWDCTIEFVEHLNRVLSLNHGRSVRIHAPFAGKSKADIVALGERLGVDYAHTWTCYRGGDHPCGTCPSCMERTRAFSGS